MKPEYARSLRKVLESKDAAALAALLRRDAEKAAEVLLMFGDVLVPLLLPLADRHDARERQKVYADLAELLGRELRLPEESVLAWIEGVTEESAPDGRRERLAREVSERLRSVVLRCMYLRQAGGGYRRRAQAFIPLERGQFRSLEVERTVDLDALPGEASSALLAGEPSVSFNIYSPRG